MKASPVPTPQGIPTALVARLERRYSRLVRMWKRAPDELDLFYSDFFDEFVVNQGMDPLTMVQWVIKESYMENQHDLQDYADKVKHFNEMKKAIRDHLTKMREMQADLAAFARSSGIDPESPAETGDGGGISGGVGGGVGDGVSGGRPALARHRPKVVYDPRILELLDSLPDEDDDDDEDDDE